MKRPDDQRPDAEERLRKVEARNMALTLALEHLVRDLELRSINGHYQCSRDVIDAARLVLGREDDLNQERWTVVTLLEFWLKGNGFEGLYNPVSHLRCYCELGGSFPPCQYRDYPPNPSDLVECRPGYKVPCDCGGHDFHIVPHKPAQGVTP